MKNAITKQTFKKEKQNINRSKINKCTKHCKTLWISKLIYINISTLTKSRCILGQCIMSHCNPSKIRKIRSETFAKTSMENVTSPFTSTFMNM